MLFSKGIELRPGDIAPDFVLTDGSGEKHRLSDYRGKPVVVYFYPKDDTPGCTKEACAFRDDYPLFEELGVRVFGLSYDTPVQRLLLNRMMVSGVVETPHGAHFTTCVPDYERDEKFQKAYAAAASGSDQDWAAFEERFLSGDETAYQAAVAAFTAEQQEADR